jgi:hypothetical protein
MWRTSQVDVETGVHVFGSRSLMNDDWTVYRIISIAGWTVAFNVCAAWANHISGFAYRVHRLDLAGWPGGS